MSRSGSRRTHRAGRTWSATELLIIGLVSQQTATTLYALQKETLLSPGALVPSLAKLESQGLIRSEQSGPRGRKQFSVPRAIVNQFLDNWKAAGQRHIHDCDAVLKLCKAAEMVDLPQAIEYARSAAELRAKELAGYGGAASMATPPEVNPFSYQSYRAVARFYRLKAEEQTLRAIEAALRTDL